MSINKENTNYQNMTYPVKPKIKKEEEFFMEEESSE